MHLKVVENSVREMKGTKGTWEKLEFKFKVLGIQVAGDGSPVDNYDALIGQHLYGSVNYRFNTGPECRLKQWVEAILAMELTLGFDLDTDLLNNRQVRGITGTYDKRNTDPRTGLPLKGMQVESLLPMGGGMPAPTPTWAAPAVSNGPSPTPSATGPLVPVPSIPGWDDPPPF